LSASAWIKAVVVVTASLLVVAGGVAPAADSRCSEPLQEVFRTDSAYSIDSIDVISPDDVWAVGESEGPYLVHWDGETWTEMEGPLIDGRTYLLKAVSGVMTDDVWAVGLNGFENRHVVIHWDGLSWERSETPSVGRRSSLHDVVALADGTAYAVGYYRPRESRGIRALVLRFDGASWSREQLGLTDIRFTLENLDGHSGDALWVTPYEEPLALTRTNEGWTKVALPRDAALRDVAVTPEGSAWFAAEGGGRRRSPIVWRYFDGTWERFDLPDRRYSEYLFSVAALSDSEVWAVGYRITGDTPYSYVARLTETGFDYVPGEDMAFWAIDLDQTGGVWAGGEAGPARIQRAC
jgi:hypothetical protein